MNSMPIPKNLKLVRVHGISDKGKPTQWFPSAQARDEEARRRFAIFTEEMKRELTGEREGLSEEETAAITKAAREYAADRVYGIYCDIAQAEADSETGVVPEMWRLMNDETEKLLKSLIEQKLREDARKAADAEAGAVTP